MYPTGFPCPTSYRRWFLLRAEYVMLHFWQRTNPGVEEDGSAVSLRCCHAQIRSITYLRLANVVKRGADFWAKGCRW
jgi:hypothetical protein